MYVVHSVPVSKGSGVDQQRQDVGGALPGSETPHLPIRRASHAARCSRENAVTSHVHDKFQSAAIERALGRLLIS